MHTYNNRKAQSISIYTDGSYCQKSDCGGWGVQIISQHKNYAPISGCSYNITDSAHIELIAALHGLLYIATILKKTKAVMPVTLVLDCQQILNEFNSAMTNSERNKYGTVIRSVLQILAPSLLLLKKVRAHSGVGNKASWANSMADKAARKQLIVARKTRGVTACGNNKIRGRRRYVEK